MEAVIIVVALVVLGAIIFGIYFTFKIFQFIIMAVNLYKKMIAREDAMIKLLIDIRDNTKKYNPANPSAGQSNKTNQANGTSDSFIDDVDPDNEENGTFFCDNCKAEVPSDAKKCPKCGSEFE